MTEEQTIITKEQYDALMKRDDCSEEEINQIKSYLRVNPADVATPEFARWLPHHKQKIMDMNRDMVQRPAD